MKDVTVYTHGGMIRNLQAPTKRKLIVMPRGSLKCVDPDSLITLPNAEQKKASELVVGDSVLSWSTKGFSANRISAKQINVSQNMREILFRSGKKIRVSHNHPLLTIEGFKQPNEITIGTRIGSWAGNTIEGYRIDNKYDTSYTKFKKFSDEINMSWACSDEITWDEIRSVSTYIGPSIDFEIENDHTFLVDGIITHNSSIGITAYSIWKLINNPNERILIDSEVYENSKNFLREIKAYLQSPHMTEVFGDFRGSVWGEGELTITQRTHPYKEASITAGGVNTVKVGQHYSTICVDDLNSGNNSGTPEMRAKVLNHYRLNDAILDPGGTYVVIGTRYADDDVIGNILKNEIGIK